MIWWNTDRFLLGILVTATAVAKLVVPQQVAYRVHFLVHGACSGLFPRFSAERETQVRQSIFLHATWIATAASVILFVPAMVVLPRFLLWWVGPDFGSDAAFIGELICIGCILRGSAGVIDAAFKGCGKPQYLTWQTIALGILAISTNVILISLLGLSGAGYSYVITGLVFPCMLAVAWRSVMSGRRIAALLRPVGLPLLIGLLLSGLVLALRNTLDRYPLFSLLGVAAAAMAAAAGLLVGLDYVLGSKDPYGIPAIRRCLGIIRRRPAPSSSLA
jgi:O-antigen/teichoic acid export membrane protein